MKAPPMSIALWLVLAAALVASATDIRTRKIPNALVLALGVASLAAAATDGVISALIYLAVLVVCIALGTIVHALRLLGGGDVKLLAFSAAALGIHDGLAFLLFVAVSGGVAGLVYSLIRGTLPQTLVNVRSMLFCLATGTNAGTPVNGTQHLPYALAIFSGAVLLALSKTFVPELRLPV